MEQDKLTLLDELEAKNNFEQILNETRPLEQRSGKFVTKKGGQIVNVQKIGRNSKCPICERNGITIKYKKCGKHYRTSP